MSQKQQKNHAEFTATFPSGTTRKWQQMVEDWNANPKASNPYIEPVVGKYCSLSIHFMAIFSCSFPGTSITSLRLEIAKEEAALTETGIDQPHEMTPAVLIQNGLDLEEQQYVDYSINCMLFCWSDSSLEGSSCNKRRQRALRMNAPSWRNNVMFSVAA